MEGKPARRGARGRWPSSLTPLSHVAHCLRRPAAPRARFRSRKLRQRMTTELLPTAQVLNVLLVQEREQQPCVAAAACPQPLAAFRLHRPHRLQPQQGWLRRLRPAALRRRRRHRLHCLQAGQRWHGEAARPPLLASHRRHLLPPWTGCSVAVARLPKLRARRRQSE